MIRIDKAESEMISGFRQLVLAGSTLTTGARVLAGLVALYPLYVPGQLYGQSQASWQYSTNSISTTSGNVGIGTTSPSQGRLQVDASGLANTNAGAFVGNNSSYSTLWTTNSTAGGLAFFAFQGNAVVYSGNVGIGTTSPSTYLHAKGPNVPYRGQLSLEAPDYVQISFYGGPTTQTNSKSRIWYDVAANQMNFWNDVNGAPFIFRGGNVGIGTANPAHLLHVAGAIGAMEVIVSSTGADYVFEPDYHLASLPEVAEFIKYHHHLPNIPSAAEVQKKGLGVGDMQSKLLEKIEELTLHMIRVNEKCGELESHLGELEQATIQLKHTNEELTARLKMLKTGARTSNPE